MYKRLLKLPKLNSFFLFGARATGKSTFLKAFQGQLDGHVLWIDLLDPELELELSVRPMKLMEMIDSAGADIDFVIIDEVQKIPKILEVVHKAIFERNIRFALTGSSARKLKRGGANLLAGRAFKFSLYPLSFVELQESFVLLDVLNWGALPEIYKFDEDLDKKRYLNAYTQNYIKEEILMEQLIRKVDPFRLFLEVAAQCNGDIINFAKIGREAKIDAKNVKRYFEILEDTLIGFYLFPYSKSIRKKQIQSPKFYFFDTGVVRAIAGNLNHPLKPMTYAFGKAFEHLVILEFLKTNEYLELGYKFSYLKTKDGVEIDLILEDGMDKIFIEIKSKEYTTVDDLKALKTLTQAIDCQKYLLCLEKIPRVVDQIKIMHWEKGLEEIFSISSSS